VAGPRFLKHIDHPEKNWKFSPPDGQDEEGDDNHS
jgi:polyphosphate kinase 2 (PPK2 family)